MVLSDGDIIRAIKLGHIVISPPPPAEHFSPSALDLRVGDEFKKWKADFPPGFETCIRLSEVRIPDYSQLVEDLRHEADGSYIIEPGQFVLAKTLEEIHLPLSGRLAARVEGRSSYARLGLAVHMSCPTIHAGFQGTITLEIKNQGPFRLRIDPGRTCICQIVFEKLSSIPKARLLSDFQGQQSVLGSPSKAPRGKPPRR